MELNMAWPYRRYSNRGGPTTLNYERSTPTPADPAEMARIDAVMNNPAFSSLLANKQDFIKSIKEQAGSKGLSPAQLNYLASIEKSLVTPDNTWWNASNPDNISKRQFVIDYYGATGYYSTLLPKMKADPAFMPEKETWDKMWANKFVIYNYLDGRWQYTFLSFDGRTMTFKDSEIKPAEKPARKARSKKV